MTKKQIKRRIKARMILWGIENPPPSVGSLNIVAGIKWIIKHSKEKKRLKELSKEWM